MRRRRQKVELSDPGLHSQRRHRARRTKGSVRGDVDKIVFVAGHSKIITRAKLGVHETCYFAKWRSLLAPWSVGPSGLHPPALGDRHKQIAFDAAHVFPSPHVSTILLQGSTIWMTHLSNGLHGVPRRGRGVLQYNLLASQSQYPFEHAQFVSA